MIKVVLGWANKDNSICKIVVTIYLTLVKGAKSPQWKFVPGGTHKPFLELRVETRERIERRGRVSKTEH